MIKVVIADGESLVRAGVSSVLRATGGVNVVAEAENGNRALDLARRHRPNVMVMDVWMDGLDGIRAARIIQRELPSTRVVILTAIASEECVYHCFCAGAAGFLLKGITPDDLVKAVTSVAAGEFVISPTITGSVIKQFLRFDRDRARSAQQKIGQLTARQHEVLAYVVKGLGNLEIARTMYISEGAVKAHVSHLLTRLDCTNRVQAAIVAHDSGLFQQVAA